MAEAFMDFYLKEKDQLQICLVLFKRCNLRCAFCFQDHSDRRIDFQYIDAIPGNIAPEIQKFHKKLGFKRIVYRIWGGQLFSDDIPDQAFGAYRRLCSGLAAVFPDSQFCFSSNLVFDNVDRVRKLLLDTSGFTATSWDPVGRFRPGQEDVWRRNLEVFNPVCISLTLTSPNIKAILGKPELLGDLAPRRVYIEYYIYGRNWKFFAPSQDQLYDFYKLCLDKGWTHIDEIQFIKQSVQGPAGRYCTCDRSCLYLDGRLTFNCLRRSSSLPWSEFFDEEPPEEKYTERQLGLFLRRSPCLECRYFDGCRCFCMASALHRSWDPSGCALQRIYRQYAVH